MSKVILFLCLFVCSSCFNKGASEEELENFCGTISSPSKEPKAPSVFNAKCATCHMHTKDGTGPKMREILDRVPSEEWLRAFITNQDSLIQIKDKYTLQIMTWSPVKWSHSFADATKKDLDTLMSFITK